MILIIFLLILFLILFFYAIPVSLNKNLILFFLVPEIQKLKSPGAIYCGLVLVMMCVIWSLNNNCFTDVIFTKLLLSYDANDIWY